MVDKMYIINAKYIAEVNLTLIMVQPHPHHGPDICEIWNFINVATFYFIGYTELL